MAVLVSIKWSVLDLLCIQIVLFHLSEHFSYLNTPWSQRVRINLHLMWWNKVSSLIITLSLLPFCFDIKRKQKNSKMLFHFHVVL